MYNKITFPEGLKNHRNTQLCGTVLMMKIDPTSGLSRRDFLKLAGYSALGLLLPDLPLLADSTNAYLQDQQGRVSDSLLWSYSEASFERKRLKMY